MDRAQKMDVIGESPLLDFFVHVALEYQRSMGQHKPWQNHTAAAMHSLINAELSEVDAAIKLECFVDTARELTHVGNTAGKAYTILTSRGQL